MKKLGKVTIKPTSMTLRMENESVQQPFEIIEDVPVKIGRFTFPTNFMVMEMEECKEAPFILGRPFLEITRMVIDVDEGKVKMQMQNEVLVLHL